MSIDYLLTGGAGFIGMNLVHKLVGTVAKIRVLDNLRAGKVEDLAGLPVDLIVGDIRDESLISRTMPGTKVVIHLAAHTGVVESVADPEFDMSVNAAGTLNLLRAAAREKVDRFIFASTGGAILGEATPPVHEGMVPKPISSYGAGKLAAEGYCSAFWGSYGLKTISLRFSNAYGPYSYHKGSVIAKLFRQTQSGEELVIFGDGEQTRDFIYAPDLCDAIITASRNDLPYGEAIQLGSGKETSLNQLLSLMRQVVGEDSFPASRYGPRRPGEVQRNFVSIAKAEKYLNFSPQTHLLEGLRRTWAWFRQLGPQPQT
jgi:UDP-glucose 4-epimerase